MEGVLEVSHRQKIGIRPETMVAELAEEAHLGASKTYARPMM